MYEQEARQMDLTDAYGTGDVARMFEISPQRVRQLVAKGVIKGVPTRLGWLYPLEEIERVKREREMHPAYWRKTQAGVRHGR
jgi:hypothetical protein